MQWNVSQQAQQEEFLRNCIESLDESLSATRLVEMTSLHITANHKGDYRNCDECKLINEKFEKDMEIYLKHKE